MGRPTKIDAEAAHNYYQRCKNLKQTARHFGCCRHTLRKKFAGIGKPLPGRPCVGTGRASTKIGTPNARKWRRPQKSLAPTPRERRQIEELQACGFKPPVIAHESGLALSTVMAALGANDHIRDSSGFAAGLSPSH